MRWPWNRISRPVLRRRRSGGVEVRWLTARSWTQRWYPQGIDVGKRRGRRALAVSWFRQDASGRHLASRVTLVDRERARRIDIVLAVTDENDALQPAPIHAGGLAWFGDRLFVAATGQGIWEFDLGALRRVHGADAQRVRGGARRRDRRTAVVAVRTRRHPVALRCSFVGRVFDADGTPLPRVLIGEYRGQETGAIGEFTIPDGTDDGYWKKVSWENVSSVDADVAFVYHDVANASDVKLADIPSRYPGFDTISAVEKQQMVLWDYGANKSYSRSTNTIDVYADALSKAQKVTAE